MTPNRMQLSQRVTLDTIKTEKFKTEVLSVSLISPVDEVFSPRALLALSVLKRGTMKYPSQGELNRRLDDLFAASLNLKSFRYGNSHVLGYSTEMLGRAYTGDVDVMDGVLEVIEQMLFCPILDKNGHFSEKNVEGEKNNQCDAIASVINNPKAYAAKRCREVMFEGDSYGVGLYGTESAVRSVSVEELKQAYQELVFKSRYHISYIGARDSREVKELVTKYIIHHLSDAADFQVAKQVPAVASPREVRQVRESMPLSQGKLVIGFRTGVTVDQEDIFPMLMMNEIFGVSPLSKLFMNVREKLSLCYYCNSRYDIYKGVIFVASGINRQNKEKTEKEIFRQFSLLQKGKITKEELEAARKSLVNSYRSLYDSPLDVINYYMGREEFNVSCSIEDTIQKISRVTAEDVIHASQNVVIDTVFFLDGNGEDDDEAD